MKSPVYIAINIILLLLFIVGEILGLTLLNNDGDLTLLIRVISRGILGLLMVYNSLYLLLTSRWSFLTVNATPKQRLLCGAALGIVGLWGLITTILGYGTNGDPRLIWWK